MIKRTIYQKDIKIVNTQASNNRDLNYMEQSLTEIKIEIKNFNKNS